MSRILLSSVAAAVAVLASAQGAAAQTEIQWWHAMGGKLGEAVNEIADRFNKSQTDYKVIAGLQGLLYRDADRRDRRLPRQQAPAHRAGLRGRHRDHDGRQGRGLAGLPADGRRRRSRSIPRPSSARSTATTRRPTASCCRCRSTARRRCSTGTRSCSRRPGLDPEQAAEDLAGGRRRWPRSWSPRAPSAASRRHGSPGSSSRTSAPGTTCRSRPRHNGFGGLDTELKFNDPPRVKHIQMLADWTKDKALRLRRPRGQADGAVHRRRMRDEHRLVGLGLGSIQTTLKLEKVGIAMLPYYARRRAPPQNTIIGGATLWVLQGRPKAEYKGVAKFLTFLSQPEVAGQVAPGDRLRADHDGRRRAHREVGLLQEEPGPRRRGQGADAQPPTDELEGPAPRQLRADPRHRSTRSSRPCGRARRTPSRRSTRR